MSDCTPVDIPCEANLDLAASDSPPLDKRDAEVVRNYQQLIGACMYLTCFTHRDCSFAVNQCARFMSNPGPTRIGAAKRILRYLAGTQSLRITYYLASEALWILVYCQLGWRQVLISSRPARMQITLEPMTAGVSVDGLSCSLEQ